jgi:phosphoesterase RecJ-like protein
LVSSGADPAYISKNLTQRRSLAAFRILQSALSSLNLYQEAKIASLYVTKEDMERAGATVPDLEGIVDFARSLATVEVALCAMELEGGVRISLRSKAADVSKVARHFGGGGHKVASGFTICHEGYSHIQECIDIIVKKIVELELIDET